MSFGCAADDRASSVFAAAESLRKAQMADRGDDTAAGEGTRSSGLIQLERSQTPEAVQLHHFGQFSVKKSDFSSQKRREVLTGVKTQSKAKHCRVGPKVK